MLPLGSPASNAGPRLSTGFHFSRQGIFLTDQTFWTLGMVSGLDPDGIAQIPCKMMSNCNICNKNSYNILLFLVAKFEIFRIVQNGSHRGVLSLCSSMFQHHFCEFVLVLWRACARIPNSCHFRCPLLLALLSACFLQVWWQHRSCDCAGPTVGWAFQLISLEMGQWDGLHQKLEA
jgi:hypothetical protein